MNHEFSANLHASKKNGMLFWWAISETSFIFFFSFSVFIFPLNWLVEFGSFSSEENKLIAFIWLASMFACVVSKCPLLGIIWFLFSCPIVLNSAFSADLP